MTNASAILIPEASALDVDTSRIDVSEVESQEDQDFLLEKGENILRIVARAALEVGRELVEVQERFKEEHGRGAGLGKFYTSLGITHSQASTWSGKYRCFLAYSELFGESGAEDTFNALPDSIGRLVWRLPAEYKEAILADIAVGNPPTTPELKELQKSPEVKLSKAEELLAQAKARKESATTSRDEANADISIANFEQQIADLQAQIEEEKLRTAEQTEESARLEKELQKLKFDDAKVRAERVKKLSTTLTVSIPQVTADVLKFFAEIDEYPEEVRKHVYENARSLADQIADKL